MHIFISYAKIDSRDLALQLRTNIAALPGVTAWMDESLEPASSWAAQIQREIDRCDAMLVLVSPDVNREETDVISASFVLREIDYAQQLRKPIIPVMALTTRMPVQIAGIQYIDLTRNREAGVERLMRTIRQRAGLPVEPLARDEDENTHRPSPPRSNRSGLIVAVAALVMILVIGAIYLIDRGNRPLPPTPTPNFETQAALIATDLKMTELVMAYGTPTPSPNATEILATLIANIQASETAKVPTPTRTLPPPTASETPQPTPTLSPTVDVAGTAMAEATGTQIALIATEDSATQLAQLEVNALTNTPRPTEAPTSTATATPTSSPTSTNIPTATATPNLAATANAVSTDDSQATAIFLQAQSTAIAQGTEQERIRSAAFNITTAFEGYGYGSYQNYDSGIVSYGRFPFTLASDNLGTLIDRYTSGSDTPAAVELRDSYLERVQNHDSALRDDQRFKELLTEAANDPIMQAAQDELATQLYWDVIQELSIIPRGYQTPLAQALIFDIGINFGPRNSLIMQAEEELGLASRTNIAGDLTLEKAVITRLAEIRKQLHDRQAERDNLPGLKVRGDFWVDLIASGDWYLQGDENGNVNVKDRLIQVRSPQLSGTG